MEVENQTTQAAPAAEPQAQAPENSQPQVTELDGLSEWKWQGKKFTNDDFHKILTEHETYSKTSKEFETEKRFYDNLEADLLLVLEKPQLAQSFKSTYPQKFHSYLDMVLKDAGQAKAQTDPAQNTSNLPKEFMTEFEQMKERLSWHEKRAYEAEVQANTAKLDAMLPPLFKKFEMANEEQVYAKAEALLNANQKLTEKTWERLIRESHEQMQKKFDRFQSAKIKEQTEKGQRGADGGPGGAAPGQAPKRKSWEDATQEMIAAMGGKAG